MKTQKNNIPNTAAAAVEKYLLEKNGRVSYDIVCEINDMPTEILNEIIYFIKTGTYVEPQTSISGYTAEKIAKAFPKAKGLMPFFCLSSLRDKQTASNTIANEIQQYITYYYQPLTEYPF